jgi:hypothetical protein
MLAIQNAKAQDDIYLQEKPTAIKAKTALKSNYSQRIKDENTWHIYLNTNISYIKTQFNYEKNYAYGIISDFNALNSTIFYGSLVAEISREFGIEAGIGNLNIGSYYDFKVQGKGTNPDTNYRFNYKANYLRIPVMGHFNIFRDDDNAFCLQVIAGIESTIMQRATANYSITAGSLSGDTTFSNKSDYAKLLVTGIGGASLRIRIFPECYLSFQVIGHYGLNSLGNSILPFVDGRNKKHINLPVTLQAYSFGAGIIYKLY